VITRKDSLPMPAKDKRLLTEATIPLRGPLLRGKRRPRVALIGRFGAGKSTIFEGASSPVARHEKLAGVAAPIRNAWSTSASIKFRSSIYRPSTRCTI